MGWDHEGRIGEVIRNCSSFLSWYFLTPYPQNPACIPIHKTPPLNNETILDTIASVDIDWSPRKNTPKRKKNISNGTDAKSNSSIKDKLKELKELEKRPDHRRGSSS